MFFSHIVDEYVYMNGSDSNIKLENIAQTTNDVLNF
jgi:hypothetical protein